MKEISVIFTAVLLAASPALIAGDMECWERISISCPHMQISACPAGDFEPISRGCGGMDDYILIEAGDEYGRPIPGIPPTDYWLGACDQSQALCLCGSSIIADGPTDSLGRAYITSPIAAGGCVLSGGIYIAIQGKVVLDPSCTWIVCLDIQIVSPDLNADCVVNLSDLGIFGQAYGTSPAANPCCDYNDDGHCNLSDFAYLAEHYQHGCE